MPASGAFRIVALGDSLTRGAGDAPGGGGYPERVAAALRKTGLVVTVDNLAVDGSETGDFLRKVEEAAVQDRIAAANLILVSIGGNDLSHSIRGAALPGEAGAEGRSHRPRPASGLSQPSKNLLSSPNRESLFANQNPRPLQPLPRRLRPPDGSADAPEVERRARGGRASGTETRSSSRPFDVFDGRPDRLSPDRFHPGAEGYAEIAARVFQTLRVPAREARPS